MSEPVRWRAYQFLHGLGPRKAARLAAMTGVGQASMLKHLDLLHSIGFVAADDDALPARQRTWRAVPGGLRLSGLEESADVAAMKRWLQVFVMSQGLLLRDWVDAEESWPLAWREAALNYDYWLHLTLPELQQMTDEIHEVTERWNRLSHARSHPAEAEAIYVVTNAFPHRDPR